MLWGTHDVWVDVIRYHGFGPWVATDEVWVHEIMALAHGCSEGRMKSGWTLYGLPMDAREQAGNYQVFYVPVSSYKTSCLNSSKLLF